MSPRPPGSYRSPVFRRWAAWGAQRGPEWFVRLAPPVIGVVFALLLKHVRGQIRRNLRLITPVQEPLAEFRDVLLTFVHFAQALTESLARTRFASRSAFRVRGRHHVEPILAVRGGVIFLTAHTGPWDAAAMALRGEEGRKLMMLMAAEDDMSAAGLQDQIRGQAEVEVVHLRGGPLDALPALLHLREGGILVAQVDRVPRGSRLLVVELFGEAFALPLGIFKLAALAEVPLVPIFSARLGFSRNLVEVRPPILLGKGPLHEDLISAARVVAGELERHVAAFPTQWFHFPPPEPPE